ncbi:DUF2848 domain-containing protein [Mangrovitalea sediminis]|uniref:DUF2848 domain-containing protein n=1 Tax=Mangrovitalea sediminis TaxID=1982043 RepID=UPI000BE61818|nr:DUF2848 domain-containing protein [Mangrovitalea sediminis]
MKLQFAIDETSLAVDIHHCTVAGWTGRDALAIQHHIDELAALGVTPPSSVPLYYRVSSGILSQAPEIEVVGGSSSGEVEPLVLANGGHLYLGLASDHTDRDLESHSVALSKQVCLKPVADRLWHFDEVADHLESIEMRSWIQEAGSADWVLYQEGSLSAIRPLTDLIAGAGLEQAAGQDTAAAMLCGTLGAKGGVRPAQTFRMELRDPVKGRTISHEYRIFELPVVA